MRLSGPGCGALVRRFVELPPDWPERRAVLARARDGNATLDRVLAVRFAAGRSYTGEESVELTAHGSPFVLERLLALATGAGARAARPGEFTQRAYLTGRLDLAQAEAVCALIQARTAEAHRAAADQLEGGLSRRVDALRARVLELASWLEAALDHPDEDIPGPGADEARREAASLAGAARELDAARARGRLRFGELRVALVGLPNAGKSSLLNALLGADRSIVRPEPGTTRDTVEAPADLDGVEAVLVDTAGLRPDPSDPVEAEGCARARAAARGADLVVAVLDRTLPPERHRPLLAQLAGLAPAGGLLAALNKCDLRPAATAAGHLGGLPALEVSAREGSGLRALCAAVRARAGAAGAGGGSGVPERHRAAVGSAVAALESAESILAEAGLERAELAAGRLREALRALGSITGEDADAALIDRVFARFCIGK